MPAHLLSVVMPTRNRPGWLERAARSVLDQRTAELELVIVDDGSSDATPEVAGRLAADRRVRVLRNEEPLGPGGSRNRGMAAARGDLLGFCDDDDTWLPGAARVVLDCFDVDDEVGVVTSWHRVVHDDTGRAANYRGPLSYGSKQLLWFNFVALPFGVIRRDMFPDDLGVDVVLPSCEDWDLWLRCAQTRPIRTLPEVLYAYHQHRDGRVTRDGSADRIGRQRFLDKHRASMSPSCRQYHELAVAQMSAGRSGLWERLAAEYRTPVAATLAGTVLAVGAVSGALGARRRDPGLSARLTAALLGARTG
jgi:glycosyltransferase involved in cell wall biosynthesis